jgi:hypothetical protein
MFYLLCEAGAVLLYKIIRRGLCYIYTYVIYIYTLDKNVWNFLQTDFKTSLMQSKSSGGKMGF